MERSETIPISSSRHVAGDFHAATLPKLNLLHLHNDASCHLPPGKERKLSAGDNIFVSCPWTYTIRPDLIGDLCYRCLEILKPSKDSDLRNGYANHKGDVTEVTCDGCRIPYYCSRKCQNLDWLGLSNGKETNPLTLATDISSENGFIGRHQLECDALRKLGMSRAEVKKLPTDYFLMLGAIKKLRRGESADDPCSAATNSRTSRNFLMLLSHSDNIDKDENRQVFMQKLRFNLRKSLSKDEMPDDDLFLSIFGKLQINCFGIRDPFMIGVGEGLYLGPSVVDHSCNRNAVFLFDQTTIFIKAITDIPKLEDVRISYQELFVPTVTRQKRCKDGYYFSCICEHCSSKETFASLFALRCLSPGCSYAVPLDQQINQYCQKCQLNSNPSDRSHAESLGKGRLLVRRHLEGIEEIDDRMQNPEWETSNILSECSCIIRHCAEALHSSNVLLGMAYDRQGRLLLTCTRYEEAYRSFLCSLPSMRKFFLPSDTRLGLQLLIVGLLAYVVEDFTEGTSRLREAGGIFQICDGVDRPLFMVTDFVRQKCKSAGSCIDKKSFAKKFDFDGHERCLSYCFSVLTLLTEYRSGTVIFPHLLTLPPYRDLY